MTQQMFDDLIGDPPPSTVDVGAIVRREHRNRRLRQAPLVVAVLALVFGVAYAGLGSQDPGPDGSERGPGPAGPGFELVADTRQAEKASGERLSKAFDNAVRKAAPGATWADGRPPVVSDRGADRGVFLVTGRIAAAGHVGLLMLHVEGVVDTGACKPTIKNCEARRIQDPTSTVTCANPDGDCKQATGPRGERVAVRHWRPSNKDTDDYTEIRIGLTGKRVLILEVHTKALTARQLTVVASDLASQIKA